MLLFYFNSFCCRITAGKKGAFLLGLRTRMEAIHSRITSLLNKKTWMIPMLFGFMCFYLVAELVVIEGEELVLKVVQIRHGAPVEQKLEILPVVRLFVPIRVELVKLRFFGLVRIPRNTFFTRDQALLSA